MANLLMEKDNIQDSRAKLLEVINDDNNEILLIDLAIYFYLMGNLKDLKFTTKSSMAA